MDLPSSPDYSPVSAGEPMEAGNTPPECRMCSGMTRDRAGPFCGTTLEKHGFRPDAQLAAVLPFSLVQHSGT
jgi:hypothetical protein